MSNIAQFHDNTYSLELKKVWDYSDPTLYSSEDKRYTSAGYKIYWEAVDKTEIHRHVTVEERSQKSKETESR